MDGSSGSRVSSSTLGAGVVLSVLDMVMESSLPGRENKPQITQSTEKGTLTLRGRPLREQWLGQCCPPLVKGESAAGLSVELGVSSRSKRSGPGIYDRYYWCFGSVGKQSEPQKRESCGRTFGRSSRMRQKAGEEGDHGAPGESLACATPG